MPTHISSNALAKSKAGMMDSRNMQDVDFAQLQLLHVGGREGLRIPRLADFLQ